MMNLNELYTKCRTYRRFTPEAVPEEVIRAALENARISNSARNAQPLQFYAVTSREMVDAMQPFITWAGALSREVAYQEPDQRAKAFIAIVKKEGAGPFSDIDVGIAAHAITTTACSLGYGSCMLAALNIPKITELLEIPEKDQLRLVIALGKPAHKSTIVEMSEDNYTYYVDEDYNFYVPKRPFDKIVIFK